MRRKWRDPEFRQRQADARRRGNGKRADAMRRKWQDPEFRAKQLDAMRRGKKKRAAAIRRKWRDPEFRQRQADAKRPYMRLCAQRRAERADARAKAKREQEQALRLLIEKHKRRWAQSPHNPLVSRADRQARNDLIRQALADGLTMQATGDIYGLTRERIRQIVSD